jgi:type I site-specific restriction endonuclease
LSRRLLPLFLTRGLQERIAEIKRISSQIASVKSDMGRFEEQLDDCRRYRDFLYKLSPEEWRQEQAARIAQIRANRRAARAAGGRVDSRAALLCAADADAAAASATPSSASGGSRASATHSPRIFPPFL